MEIKEFKIRCSAIGQIMGRIGLTEKQESYLSKLENRHANKSGKEKPLTANMLEDLQDLRLKKSNSILPETCKSYCEQWLKEQLYGVSKEIQSKYLDKGIEVEALAIDYYAEAKNLGFVLQNVEHFEADFITGTPDLILPEYVIDMKASWDCFTYPLFETDIDKKYWMQLQGYMHLTGKRKAKLVYTLQNTPDELEWNETADYEGQPEHLRIKEFEFEYDEKFIESVQERVKLCRKYITELIQQITIN